MHFLPFLIAQAVVDMPVATLALVFIAIYLRKIASRRD